jgi:hypothetical protein
VIDEGISERDEDVVQLRAHGGSDGWGYMMDACMASHIIRHNARCAGGCIWSVQVGAKKGALRLCLPG